VLEKSYVGKRGWYFEYLNEPIFVTTFSPSYPSDNARYAYGCSSGFVLLQPEFSFAWKDIGNDTPDTNWDNPQTVRDKIRCEFKKHGQLYDIPPTIYYPTAAGIVPPLKLGMPVVEWWVTKKSE